MVTSTLEKAPAEETKTPTQLVCGAQYRYFDERAQRTYEGMCFTTMLRTTRDGDAPRIGEFKFFGLAIERIEEGSVRMNQLTMIGRPASPKVGRPRKR
jgi:hypothetical protein